LVGFDTTSDSSVHNYGSLKNSNNVLTYDSDGGYKKNKTFGCINLKKTEDSGLQRCDIAAVLVFTGVAK